MSVGEVHIIATCSHRKRAKASKGLRCRDLAETTLPARLSEWRANFESDGSETLAARDLYCGEHWQIVLRLEAVARQYCRPKLWVMSAGFGLIESDAQIKPYEATFSPNHPDSVVGSHVPNGRQAWWKGLSEWVPNGRPVASLSELAESSEDSKIMLIASPAYLRAAADDLSTALKAASDRLVIVSGDPAKETAWAPFVVRADARLQSKLGGSRQSLSDRLALQLIKAQEGEIGVERSRKVTENMLNGVESNRRVAGEKLTDRQVLAFINDNMNLKQRSATSLLRQLRDSGRSCEQKRFHRLFDIEEVSRAKRP